MSNNPSIPSSVDTSGDLSRVKFNDKIRHMAPVGDPIGGAPYRPGLQQQKTGEGSATNPVKCAIVLGTHTTAKDIEYRIGKFLNEKQMNTGLDEPAVMQTCFGNSSVFRSRNEAILAADNKYPDNTGIKVIVKAHSFPYSAS